MSDTLTALTLTGRTGPAAPASPEARQEAERLRTVAAQFESILLGQMLREMRDASFDEEDKESGFSSGPLADALYSELSATLSRAGGLGIAEAMLVPLAQQAADGVRPGSDQGQTGVRPGSDRGQTTGTPESAEKSVLNPVFGPRA